MTELIAESADLWRALHRSVEVEQTGDSTTLWMTATSEFFSQATFIRAEDSTYLAVTLTSSELGDMETLEALAELAFGRLPEVFHLAGPDSAASPDLDDGTDEGQIGPEPSEPSKSVSSGKVWVVSPGAGLVYVIDANVEEVVTRIDVGLGATHILAHGGDIWVLNTPNGTLQRIDAESSQVTETIAIKSDMHSVDAGNGSLWVAGYQGVQEIQISTGAVHNVYSGNSFGILVTENAIWVTRTFDNQVLKIDPQTRSILSTIELAGGPAEIAYGNGSIWLELGEGRRIVRVDPDRAEVLSVIPPYTLIHDLIFAGGFLWFSGGNTSSQGAVYTLDPQTEDITRYAILPHYPKELVFFRESIWTTSPSQGMIMRFNPPTKRTELVIDVGSDPFALAVTE